MVRPFLFRSSGSFLPNLTIVHRSFLLLLSREMIRSCLFPSIGRRFPLLSIRGSFFFCQLDRTFLSHISIGRFFFFFLLLLRLSVSIYPSQSRGEMVDEKKQEVVRTI